MRKVKHFGRWFVLQHHPNDIDHLTAETDERLALRLALGYLSLEICLG